MVRGRKKVKMEKAKVRKYTKGSLPQKGTKGRSGLGPESGDCVGDFCFKYFGDLFVLRLTIAPMLYKYMHIYLWSVLGIGVFGEAII